MWPTVIFSFAFIGLTDSTMPVFPPYLPPRTRTLTPGSIAETPSPPGGGGVGGGCCSGASASLNAAVPSAQ